MPRLRKPSAEQEAKGAHRHDPARRRVDPPGRGELPLAPPMHLNLSAEERACYAEIAALVPENIGSGSDVVSVELAARLLAKVRAGVEGVTFYVALGHMLNRLGLDPQGRMRIAPAVGKKKKPHEVDPLDEFAVGNQGQRGNIPAGGDGTN